MEQGKWKNRILGSGSENPKELMPNPLNWRTHPDKQRYAMQGVMGEVGWVQSVIVNQRTGRLIDGHLRVSLAIDRQEEQIPVTYVDLSEEEEALILATFDPTTEMAGINPDMLREVLSKVETDDLSIRAILDSLAEEAGLGAQAGADDEELSEEIAKEVTLQYQLVFDDENHMAAWYGFLRFLREKYPQAETVSERLTSYIAETGIVVGSDAADE